MSNQVIEKTDNRQSDYQKFRASTINKLVANDRETNHYLPTPHWISVLRERIKRFRNHLQFSGRDLLAENPSIEPNLKRALRIPAHIRLRPTGASLCFQIALFLLPTSVAIRNAKAILGAVGTFEGRHLLFELRLRRTLRPHRYLTESFDFALRRLDLPHSFEAFRDIRDLDLYWMRACVRLGARSYEQVKRTIPGIGGHAVEGALVFAMAESNVINTLDELAAIPSADRWYSRHHDLDAEGIQRFKRTAALLKSTGMAASNIVKLVNVPLHRLKPDRLVKNLAVFDFTSEDLDLMCKQVGPDILFTETDQWVYLRDELGVRTVAEVLSLRPIIDADDRRCPQFVQAMRKCGADVEALAVCQSILLSVGRKSAKEARAISSLSVLTSAPYSLSFSDLASAEDYLLHDNDLPTFLRVLTKHGYVGIPALLAFQRCYKQVCPDFLDAWLSIAAQPMVGQEPEAVSEWVWAASAGGHLEAFNYLQKSGDLVTKTHLHQALKLAPLGAPLLRYLGEVRSKLNLKSKLIWYTHDAPGIRGVKIRKMDAVTRVLLDDSFERKDFTVLNGNKTCVDEVLSNRIHNELGRFPYEASDQERNAYNQKSQVLRDKLMNEIAPRLKPLLIQTEGILLPSLMPHIEESPDKIAMRVSALKDLLGDLTHGGGPTNEQLSALEAELVAMVYRTDPHTVSTLWSKILGREGDIPGGLATTHYQMEWRRTELRLDSEIDHRGLSALLSALEFASRFRTHYRADMFEACRHLSPKRLQDDARDVLSLAQHLGVLFALADEDRNIRTWLENGKHNLEELIEAGPRAGELLGSLEKLLTVDLKDAFSARVQEFCAAIPAADAEILTSKLDLPNGRDDEATASDLSNTLRTTYEVVLEKYEQWIAVQRRRLVAKEVSGIGSAMFARVSKSPAAFFAKEAAAICTRLNTDMWVEERNSHMLVFAPDSKRLMGMALIYLQKVNAIDPHRNTLIIRAINPMQDALATFSASSIVDSYFDVAIRIAHDVGAVAVAFPHPTGMDLMSNNPTIEKDIKTRFIEPSVNAPYRSSEKASLPSLLQPHRISEIFYAFESGEAPVEQLFAIWRSAPPINE